MLNILLEFANASHYICHITILENYFIKCNGKSQRELFREFTIIIAPAIIHPSLQIFPVILHLPFRKVFIFGKFIISLCVTHPTPFQLIIFHLPVRAYFVHYPVFSATWLSSSSFLRPRTKFCRSSSISASRTNQSFANVTHRHCPDSRQ